MVPHRPLVLLLEDEPLIGFDVEQRLRYFGFRVSGPLRSGSDALEWVGENHADVVVLDIELLDGECSRVAETLFSRKVPFVVHTAFTKSDADHAPIFDEGLWVGKLSLPMELVYAVRTSLSAHQSGRCIGRPGQVEAVPNK